MTSRQLLKCLLAIRKRLYSQGVVPRLELIWFRVGGLRFKAFKIPGWKGSRSAQGLRVMERWGDHIFWSQMGEDDAPQEGSEGYRATSERKKRNMASQESNYGGTISFEARWGKTMHLRGVQKATGQRRRERREIWLPRKATTGGPYLLKPDGGRRCTSGGFRRLQGNVGEKEEKYGFPGKQQGGDHIFWSQTGEDDAPQGGSEGYRATSERKKRNMASQGSNNGGTISFEARWRKTMHLRGVQKATGQRRRERREIWLPRKATTGGPYLLKPDGGRRCTSGEFRRLQGNGGTRKAYKGRLLNLINLFLKRKKRKRSHIKLEGLIKAS